MFKHNKKKKIDWLYISIVFLLVTIFLTFCYLVGNKDSKIDNNKVVQFLEREENTDTGNENSHLFEKWFNWLLKQMNVMLNGVFAYWIKSIIIVPILQFLGVFTLIIYKLTGGSLLQQVVSGGEDSQTYLYFNVPKMFLFVGILSALTFLIILTVNVLIILFSPKEDNANLKRTCLNVMVASFFFCALPIAFFLLMIIFNTLMDLFNYGISQATGSTLFQFAIPDAIANLGVDTQWEFTKEGTSRWDVILNEKGYSVLFPTICCVMFLIGYASMAVTIIQQLFQLVVLYLWAPMALINYTNDDGQVFKTWFGQFRNKLITNFSIILGFQIYGYINPIITRYTASVSNDNIVLMLIKIITLLGGLMFLMGFPTLVGQFTGESLSMREGQQALGFVTGKAMRVNPVGKLSSKANTLRKNSQGYQIKSMAKNDLMKKKAANLSAVMQMKGESGSTYKKHNAWVEKQLNNLNRKAGKK